jgi:hypothetical protein
MGIEEFLYPIVVIGFIVYYFLWQMALGRIRKIKKEELDKETEAISKKGVVSKKV